MGILTGLFALLTAGTFFLSLLCVPIFFIILSNARSRAALFGDTKDYSMPHDDRLAFWLGALVIFSGIGAIIENL